MKNSGLGFNKKSYVFSKFCLHIEMFQSENSFLQGLINIYICRWPDIFLCLTLQKTVFWSLPFRIWTQFGEQIAIIFLFLLPFTWRSEMYDFCKFFLEEVNVRKKNIQDLETLQFLLAFRNYATSLSSIIRIKKLDFRS